ncbi:hypothetical protein [Mycobacterium paragordonae]|uniref:Uncharacterized protein n=1 Tax=Mycobacterium paragordonae TaxID=1389713 RepID=A0AAJ1SJR5_9MYCO|nr:hypothetical protein [Mycobacterium paragordonae]MDP7739478.1 hypothetical protein [Mycobacterium paragordonae]PJE23847.1 MAG: hypothetical protein CK431_09205 [Mycobacterium sp.]
MDDLILLENIISFYLDSRDFNGLPIYEPDKIDVDAASELVRQGLVQVVSDEDYMNPHIRPWPSGRSIEDQVDSLQRIKNNEYMVCLYPTAVAMKDYDFSDRYKDRPYHRRMAEGKGALELAFFRYDVLEPYRNDPRFVFRFNDYGVEIWLNDDLYIDESEPEADKTAIDHVGFAYDLSKFDKDDPDSEIRRLVCALYVDLCKLNSAHQLRWSTYEVEPGPDVAPHHIWWGSQMGHWPDGMGTFERFFFELKTLNKLFADAHRVDLVSTVDRPDGLGWILRPSQSEFDSFVHQLDKLLSDNLRHKAFDELGIARRNDADELIGSLNRLDLTLERFGVSESARSEVLEPLRNVRRLRQKPAHALRENVTNATFVHHQASLLRDVTTSVELLRRFWQTHPANAGWKEPEHATEDARSYWL